jgi:cobalamin biosynthesis Mg chelatase CobN
MPRVRESLESAKARLVREQRTRTDRRVDALLRRRQTGQDAEILDDSEEENRVSGRRARATREKATQTDSSSSSFCCSVLVGVFLVVCLVCSLILYKTKNA